MGSTAAAWVVGSPAYKARPQVGGEGMRGAMRAGAFVCLVTNDSPMPTSSRLRRSGKLVMGLGGGSPPIEGIPGVGVATCPNENATPFTNIPFPIAAASQPAAIGFGVRRGSKKEKNGNWIDA
jgi:hypothetical protein